MAISTEHNANVAPANLVGQLIDGRYEVLKQLTSSSYGSSHLVNSQVDGCQYLLKSRFKQALPTGFFMRLEHEVRVVHRLTSQHYQAPLEYLSDQDVVHVVFPYHRGVPLNERRRDQPLKLVDAFAIGAGLLSGLRDLHENQILHRAVRPSNLIVNSAGDIRSVQLTDLGASHPLLSSAESLEKSCRNARYYSPEQSGTIDSDVTVAADLYAVGIVLFECLTGYAPFSGDDLHTVLYSHMTTAVPSLRSLGHSVPRAVDEFVHRLLKKDPRDRYQSAEAALMDWQAIRVAWESGEAEPKIVIGACDSRSTLIEPAFVSRDAELSRLEEAFEAARGGQPGLILLEGESGAGKSRLLTEASHRAARCGFRLLKGVARNDVASRPFQILDGVLARFLADAKLDPEFATHVKTFLDQDCEVVASAFPEVREILAANGQAASGPELTAEMRTIRALTHFLMALGTPESPALILLDDCQWADELTHKLIRHWQTQLVGKEQIPVILVAGFRTEEVEETHLLRQLQPPTHIRLTPFQDDEIRQLVESMAGRLPNEAIEIVIQFAGGSPFMASAVLQGLVESGALVHEKTHWRLDSTTLTQIHSSNREAEFLTRRLDLLSEEILDCLSAGALIGNEFDLHMVAELTQHSGHDAISALDVARQRRLIWSRPDGVSFVFMHDKIRRALLDRLDEDQLGYLHLQAAHYLQTHQESKFAELAYHFDAAGACDLAFPHAMKAAEESRNRHALEAAEQQYRIALRGVSAAPIATQYQVTQGLGDVLMLRGKYDDAQQLFEKAASLVESDESRAQVQGKLAELSFKRGDMDSAVTEYEHALGSLGYWIPQNKIWLTVWLLWEVFIQVCHTYFPRFFVHRFSRTPTESQQLSFRLFSGLAHGCWYCRGSLNTLWAHLRGMNLAEQYEPTPELGNAYSEHAPVMSLLGMFSRAIRYAEQSLEIRRNLNDLWGQGQSLHYYGVVLYAASRYSECINRCRESIRLLERMGDYWQVHIARYQIAASYYRLGELDVAIEEAKKNHRSGLALGDELASGINLDIWARAAHGRLPDGILAREMARERSDAQGQAQVLFASAVCHLREGQPQEACDQIEGAVQIVTDAGVCNSYTLPIMAWSATAYRSLAESLTDYTPNRRAELIRKAGAAAKRARKATKHCQNDLPHIFREQGLIFSLQGRQVAARRAFAKSLDIATRIESRYEYAQTVMARAKVGKEFDWAMPADALENAQCFLAEIGMLETSIAGEDQASASPSLSLADRFETILESGRSIATALSESAIYRETFAAACQLLRVQEGMILEIRMEQPFAEWPTLAGTQQDHWSGVESLIEKSLGAGRAMNGQTDDPSQDGQVSEVSEICTPLYRRGKPVACLYARHSEIRDLFGSDEERLLDFLATIAGAALENAEGFTKLQELNANLERRVKNRTAVLEAKSRDLTASNEELERTAHELRQAQVELSASQQAAEAASEAKSRFLATMSHEIRTPMNGILGMAELVLGSPLTDRQRGYLDTLKGSANALLTLLNDLLDFSKIEAGKMELETIPFSLRDVVLDSARLLAVPTTKKGLDLICRVEPDVPAKVIGDPNRLRQILVNLLGNAIKFTPRGEVEVTVQSLNKSPHADEHQLRFSVRDTGIGIPKDKQKSVFEAFHQTDSSVTRRFGGTGLGLAISTQLVSLMDGAISLESQENRGTTFHVDLTFPNASDDTSIENQDGSEIPVRIVSDHEGSARSVKGQLEFLGIPSQVESPDSLLKQNDFEGIWIFDLSVTPAIWWEEIFSHLPQHGRVIGLVPAGQPELLERCEDRGIEHLLTKPTKPQELLQTMRAIQKSEVPEDVMPEDAPKESGSLRILVADDSPVNREVAMGMLEMCGHQAETVCNGAEAVEAHQNGRFDLIFMDLEMPVMDGLAAARAIRCLPSEKSSIPIYAMTAHALEETDQKCRDAGMDGHITKPIAPDQLMQLLSRIAAGT